MKRWVPKRPHKPSSWKQGRRYTMKGASCSKKTHNLDVCKCRFDDDTNT